MRYTKELNIKPGKAICYSGFREGQRPGDVFPTYEEIKEDLLILQNEWTYLRLYDCDKHSEIVLEVIEKENFNFKHPGPDSSFLPTKFRFFNDLFPNIDPLSSLEISKYNGSNDAEMFVDKGMKYAKDNKVFDSRRGLISDTKIKTILGVKDK